MAVTFYGSAISPNSITTLANAPDKGASHLNADGRKRSHIALSGSGAVATDIIRMITVRSNDPIDEVWIASNGAATAFTGDIGLYLAGDNHDGAVVDVDLFGSAVATGTAAYTEVFGEAAVALNGQRGKMVWEILGLSADSGVLYDVAVTATTVTTLSTHTLAMSVVGSGGS